MMITIREREREREKILKVAWATEPKTAHVTEQVVHPVGGMTKTERREMEIEEEEGGGEEEEDSITPRNTPSSLR